MTDDWKPTPPNDVSDRLMDAALLENQRAGDRYEAWQFRPEPGAVFRSATTVPASPVAAFVAPRPVPERDPVFDMIAELGRAGEKATKLTVSVRDVRTIVFIDPAVTDISTIVRAASTDAEIVLLDDSSDGLDQIAAHLGGRAGIEVVHIVCRGEPGKLHLGCTALTSQSIGAEHAAKLSVVRSALVEQADVLLYGCDVSLGMVGLAFVELLSKATGATVLARGNAEHSGASGEHEEAIGARHVREAGHRQ